MTYNVTISPSGRQFKVDIGTTVLEAALDQGIVLPYARTAPVGRASRW